MVTCCIDRPASVNPLMNNQINGAGEQQSNQLEFEDYTGIMFVIPDLENGQYES